MIGYNHNRPTTGKLVRSLKTLSAACLVLFGAPAAFALDTGDIVVTSLKGEVHVTMNGTERPVRAGAVLELPATVRTGADGAIELRQGATTVGVGPDTLLEFPALEKPGGPIDRIVQPRGNAFYSIGKRPGRKLRVETPYLVGVVKGTQFNVVAQEGATTISLFEGLLEIRSADDSDVIDLHAGEIAARSRSDTDISVLKMSGNKAPPAQGAPPKPATPAVPPAPRSPSGADGKGRSSSKPDAPRAAPASDLDSLFADRDSNDRPAVNTPTNVVADVPVDVVVDRDLANEVSAPAVVDVGANVAAAAPVVDLGIDVAAAPDLGAPAISSPVDSGSPAISNVTDAVADVAPPVDLAVDAGGSAAPVDLGVSAGTNGGGVADVAVDVTPAPGLGVPADVAVNVNVDPVAEQAANVDLSVGAGNAHVDLGISVGGDSLVDVNLGLDDDNSSKGSNNSGSSGQGNDDSGPGNNGQGSDDTGSVVDDVSNLLDKLRGKSGKK
jgi:hypothetical protein